MVYTLIETSLLNSMNNDEADAENENLIHLYNEDCIQGMRNHVKKKSIDVVVTSPPYNLGITYNKYDDKEPRESYLLWLEEVIIEIKRRLKDEGSFFLNFGSKPSDPWGPFEIAMMIREHFELQNTIHWIKSIYIENDSYGCKQSVNVGHYKPINSKRFLNDTHEYIFHFTKNNNIKLDRLAIGVPYKDDGNRSRWKDGKKGIRCRGNVWYIPYKTINSREKERPHPASFPSELAEMCIKLHGERSDTIIMDPFMGIGNTSLACRRMGLCCIGFEIDRAYYETNLSLLKRNNSSNALNRQLHSF